MPRLHAFTLGGTLMVSKKELQKLLPEFWNELKSGKKLIRAFSRESLNGNFLNGSLYDPEVTVNGKTARASVRFVTPAVRWKTLLFLKFKKKENTWYITQFKWDMG